MRRAIRSRGKAAASALLLALALSVMTPTIVEAKGPLYGSTYPTKISNKLLRGVGNTAFCWCEIPIEINREIQSTDPFTGFFTGLVRGLWFTGTRLVLGVVDIVTFPFDTFSNNYQSVQRTEFPFIDEVE